MDSKTLIIYASPKSNSFTKSVLTALGYNEQNADFFNCYKNIPKPCFDCGLCKKEDACVNHDLDIFFEDFQNAKHIVFAFPVYNCGLPAPLKALTDRFQRYFNKRFARNIIPPMRGKRDVTIVMTMGAETDVSEYVLKQFKPLFTISGCRLKKTVTLSGTDRLKDKNNISDKIKITEE